MTRPAADDAAVRLWNSLGCPAWKLREIADAIAAAKAEGLAAAAYYVEQRNTPHHSALAAGIRALLAAGKERTE